MGARSYRASRVIDAPASVVWRLLTDADSYAVWNDAVVRIEGSIAECTYSLVDLGGESLRVHDGGGLNRPDGPAHHRGHPDLTESFAIFADS